MYKGYDISSVQNLLTQAQWNAIAASGITFIVAKCGNGNDPIDPHFSQNIAGAKAAGLHVACYHFVYPLPPKTGDPSRSPQAQAQMHFNAAQGVLAAMDIEWPVVQDWSKWDCTAAQINQWGLDYLAAYSELSGQTMMIYTFPNFAQTVGFTAEYAQYPLWIASYEPTPTIPAPWTNWVMWQTAGGTGGHLPNGAPVDTDVVMDLSLWAAGTSSVSSTNSPNGNNNPNPVSTPNSSDVPNTPVINANFFSAIWNLLSKLFGK